MKSSEIVLRTNALEAIREILDDLDVACQIVTREISSRCICGWNVQLTQVGNQKDSEYKATELFEAHVASGDCPEERDEEGNVLHPQRGSRSGSLSRWE